MFLLASSVHTVFDLISNGGYFVLFGLLFACGLGLPLPEDIPLFVAGVLIARGTFSWLGAAVFAWSGIIGGDLILYHVGKRFGRGVCRIPFIGRHVNAKRLDYLEAKFLRYGVAVVAVGRMIAIVRGAMVVVAGTMRFPLAKFLAADGLAAIVSGGLFMGIGYYVGHELSQATYNWFHDWAFAGGIALGALVLVWFLWQAARSRSLARRAAALGAVGLAEIPADAHDPNASFNLGKAGKVSTGDDFERASPAALRANSAKGLAAKAPVRPSI